MWWLVLAQMATAQSEGCRDLFVAGLTAPVRRAEVLARKRTGPQSITHEGRTREVFVNPGIPPDGDWNISIVRSYASRKVARATYQQLFILSEAGWSTTGLFGLNGHDVVLDLTEGPNLSTVWRDPAREDLRRAYGELLGHVEGWAAGHRLHVQRRGDELRVRGSYRRRRVHFKLRPEHIVVDLIKRRLVIDDVDAD